MSETRLLAELTEAKAEVQRLRERMSIGTLTVHKDLSLITLVPKCSGSNSAVLLEEFFSSIDSAARIGRWQDRDCFEIAALKLVDSARIFYQECSELHEPDATWQTFKNAFRQRFRNFHTDQFHYMKLQTARQARNENPQEFADRCRALAQKIMCKVDDPVAQRVHNKNAERKPLASFVAGVNGEPGRQTRFANTSNIYQALRIALAVQEEERQEKSNSSFYTKFENSAKPQSRSPNQRYSENNRSRHSVATRTVSKSTNKTSNSKARSAQTKGALRCYVCGGLGHFALNILLE